MFLSEQSDVLWLFPFSYNFFFWGRVSNNLISICSLFGYYCFFLKCFNRPVTCISVLFECSNMISDSYQICFYWGNLSIMIYSTIQIGCLLYPVPRGRVGTSPGCSMLDPLYPESHPFLTLFPPLFYRGIFSDASW